MIMNKRILMNSQEEQQPLSLGSPIQQRLRSATLGSIPQTNSYYRQSRIDDG